MNRTMARKKLYQPHYSTTSDARVLQTRQSLRRALLELIDSKPLEQISIREITSTAGIGYNTFFRHYVDKDALVRAIVSEELSELIELSISTLDATNSGQAALALCRFVAEHDALWSTLLTGGAANTLRDEFVRLLRERAVTRVASNSRLPVEVGINLVAVGTLEVLKWWLTQAERETPERLAEIYAALVVAPVANAYRDARQH